MFFSSTPAVEVMSYLERHFNKSQFRSTNQGNGHVAHGLVYDDQRLWEKKWRKSTKHPATSAPVEKLAQMKIVVPAVQLVGSWPTVDVRTNSNIWILVPPRKESRKDSKFQPYHCFGSSLKLDTFLVGLITGSFVLNSSKGRAEHAFMTVITLLGLTYKIKCEPEWRRYLCTSEYAGLESVGL